MERRNKFRVFNRFWDNESGLFGMLILLALMHFVLIPIFGSLSSFMITLNIFWMLFLIAGIFSLATNNKQAILIAVIPLMFVVFGWISIFSTNPFILFAAFLLTLCTLLLLVILVLKKVFEPGPITGYRIAGSIVVYMILANIWAVLYLYLYNHMEGSFQLTLPNFKTNSLQANFMYFSYITITTTGFGEVVPLHPFARSLVQVEAFTGVLYPVILIGRLVSDAGSNKQK